MAILTPVNGMTHEQMQAEILKLREANAKLRESKARALSWKVSEKGALSIYGMGRFPVTLYWSQFSKLRAVWDDFCAFADAAHANGELSVRED